VENKTTFFIPLPHGFLFLHMQIAGAENKMHYLESSERLARAESQHILAVEKAVDKVTAVLVVVHQETAVLVSFPAVIAHYVKTVIGRSHLITCLFIFSIIIVYFLPTVHTILSLVIGLLEW
jgi:hypothetical protein